jgi:hypothetical protein
MMFVLAKAVDPNAAVSFVVTAPGSANSNTAFNITVQAKRADAGNANTYTGTVHITCTDGAAVLPADAALVAGFGTFSVKLMTAGTWTFTATDTVNSAIKGTSSGVTVAAIIPGSVTLTSGASWTVPTGFNPANNTVECYGGGGGGGYGDNSGNYVGGGGGGGGGYAKYTNLNLTPGASIAIGIGFGGPGAPVGSARGSTGGSTWVVNTSTVRADPGQGGYSGSDGSGGPGPGGAGAGQIVYTGGSGDGAYGSELYGTGGGAAGPAGNGGVGAPANSGGGLAGKGGEGESFTGVNYGGGGAGGSAQGSSDHAGGTGAQGCIKITWS